MTVLFLIRVGVPCANCVLSNLIRSRILISLGDGQRCIAFGSMTFLFESCFPNEERNRRKAFFGLGLNLPGVVEKLREAATAGKERRTGVRVTTMYKL